MFDFTINKKSIYIRWFLLRLGLVLFDILAVNAAYFLALVVRFYVNFEFNAWAVKYVPAFFEFAPYYTVCALLVFYFLGLYKSIWKYAGLNDMNRLLLASAITCVIHILGTLLFVMRMPITYYVFGAVFQFVLITISRFSYRLLVIERDKFFKHRKHDAINVMVVGIGEAGRTVIKHLDRDPNNIARPVCMIDVTDSEFRGTMAGVPVLGGINAIKSAVKKYTVDRVLIADAVLPAEIKRTVREICKESDVSVQDFSSFFQSVLTRITLNTLLEYVEGPVEIEIDGTSTRYDTALLAQKQNSEKYIVTDVSAQSGVIYVKVIRDILLPNDTHAEWVQDYQRETGEDISFF